MTSAGGRRGMPEFLPRSRPDGRRRRCGSGYLPPDYLQALCELAGTRSRHRQITDSRPLWHEEQRK